MKKMKKKKSEDFVTTISVTKFNENISKYIQQAESEVIYIEKRGMTRVVMLSKTMFDIVMQGYLEFQKTKNGLN